MNPESESKVKSAQLVLESTLQHVELQEPFFHVASPTMNLLYEFMV